MTYKIDQSDTYIGSEYWKWSAWIDATDIELDRIESVIWILHPTFNPSTVEVTDRETKFMLNTSGWGTFRLKAEMEFRSGETKTISTMLKLNYPEELNASATGKPEFFETATKPTIFLSFSSEDEGLASMIQASMQEMGMKVLDKRRYCCRASGAANRR
jgi:transcription initiation factor IIF auxiliary subunit